MLAPPVTLAWLLDLAGYWSLPGVLLLAFQVWMFVDALRRGEYLWAGFIFLFSVLSAVLYYFLVYRGAPSVTRGFELPGAHSRRRIKELEAQIHHLDKAHHHSQLGDLHFQRGKLEKAEACYRAALERDPGDLDTRAHLGQCLLRQRKPAEARPLLAQVCTEDPRHDYGHSLMALAETQGALGELENAIATWQRVLQDHSYARARVQLAELYQATQQTERAAAELHEVLADDAHAPTFQRRRDRVWVRRAKALLRRLK
jgi:tetratricopeptide (TPR) repeat protein